MIKGFAVTILASFDDAIAAFGLWYAPFEICTFGIVAIDQAIVIIVSFVVTNFFGAFLRAAFIIDGAVGMTCDGAGFKDLHPVIALGFSRKKRCSF